MFSYPFNFAKTRGHFIGRLNRFVVEVEVENRRVEAYLANPGRLWELLLPGTELLLAPSPSGNKLPYTVLACRRSGKPVLLHTHLTNAVITRLIDEKNLPGFENYRVDAKEPACGRHRFDLLLKDEHNGEEFFLEVKTCTLFAGRVAMFPDAVTRRGAGHLRKLQELAANGMRTGCLFAVMNPQAEYFLPAYHMDPHFSQVFLDVRDTVQLSAIALGFESSFSCVNSARPLSIPFDLIGKELADRGSYLLLLTLDKDQSILAGSLGAVPLKQGHYIYVGSAMQNLGKRIARHLRRKKQKRWHIDYLVEKAAKRTAVPVVSSERLECELAASLQKIAAETVRGFGSSDCNCPGHLFYFSGNPLHDRRFIDLLQYYRIGRLEEKVTRLWE